MNPQAIPAALSAGHLCAESAGRRVMSVWLVGVVVISVECGIIGYMGGAPVRFVLAALMVGLVFWSLTMGIPR